MFNYTTQQTIIQMFRMFFDILILWVLLYYTIKIVRNNSRTAQIFKGIILILIIRAIANNEHSVLPLGVYLDGEYGLSDVVLNVPVVVTKEGASKILNYKLLPEELEALHVSAKVMQKMANEVL